MESERTSLIQRLGQLLGGKDAPLGPAASRRREASASAHVRTGGRPNPESPAPGPDRIAAGSLQLIGLSGIRNTLGERWGAHNEQISRLIEAIFRRRLDIADAYFRVDDENFLILFTRLRRHEAEFKARAIAEEIEKLIVGEDIGGQEIAVVSCVAEIDRRFVLEKVNSLDELIDHVRTAANTEWHEADAGGPLSQPAGEAAYSSYIPELEQDFSVLFQRTSTEDYLKQCSASFRPMFNTKRRIFSSFLTSVISKRTGRMVLVDDDPLLDKPEELLPALDRFTLGAALLGLHRMIGAGQQTKLVIPISYDTLSIGRLREQYFSRLRDVPDGIRTLIAFALTNLPVGMPASRLGDLISYLRPLSSLQVAHVAADVRLADIYAGTGCYGLSTEIPVDQPDASRLQADMSSFVRRTHLHRSVAILANINSRDDLRTGVAAGFDIIWGDAVSGTVDTPGLRDGLRGDHIPG